ncbi:MAG: SGNH/GDSL hydrolase family protein [Isosphaeraceae bacterium]
MGDTFVERDQKYGYLETIITARNPGKNLVFRNLGWSGDTAQGLSRSGFGKPDEGWRHLREHVLALKPTVLIVGYGMAESFAGEAGLASFVSGLNTLLDTLAPLNARTILLSPIGHEDLGRPLPDPSRHNAALALYRDAIRKVADERSTWFVDLYEPTLSAHDYGIDPLTDNGIHPTAYGHWYLATVIDLELRKVKRDNGWGINVGPGGRIMAPPGVKVEQVETSPGQVRFSLTDASLPLPPAPKGAPEAVIWLGSKRTFRFNGLPEGRYTLKVDGKPVATETSDIWGKAVPVEQGPEFDQVEALRRAINRKNELYFYRWRPQNETYLFGFRKHEQGNNAREIPLFDPLVAEQEEAIARLRRPVKHTYELLKAQESEVTQ